MVDQVQEQPTQQSQEPQPLMITLSLTAQQVLAVLTGLGELKTDFNVWPLKQIITQQFNSQLPPAPEAPAEEPKAE